MILIEVITIKQFTFNFLNSLMKYLWSIFIDYFNTNLKI